MNALRRLLPILALLFGLAGCATGIDCAAEQACAPVGSPTVSSSLPCAEAPTLPLAARCDPCGPRTPRGEVYAGLAVVAVPAIGVGLELGQRFARTHTADWAFEVQALWQDLGAAFCCDTSGTWAQIGGGVKATLRPHARSHPVFRGGFAWFRTTGSTELVEEEGDYVSLYVGAGWEFDITPALTTGPEIRVMVASIEKEFDPIVVPQVQWHLVWRF